MVWNVHFNLEMLAEMRSWSLCEVWLRRENNLRGIAIKLA